MRATHRAIDDAIEASGLNADEFAVYSVLASDGTVTPTTLARWMAAPATTVSSYIKRFERCGYVRRPLAPYQPTVVHIASNSPPQRARPIAKQASSFNHAR